MSPVDDTWWYVSCSKFTVAVHTRDFIITESPPITRKFIGQDLSNLLTWAEQRFKESVVLRELDR